MTIRVIPAYGYSVSLKVRQLFSLHAQTNSAESGKITCMNRKNVNICCVLGKDNLNIVKPFTKLTLWCSLKENL